jgi:DNA polymerase IIIc chi subunit
LNGSVEGSDAATERRALVVSIVGAGDEDRQMARSRWRSYRAAGFTLETHDL